MNFISRSVTKVLSSSLYHSRAAKLPTRKWVISRQITSGGGTEAPEKESALHKDIEYQEDLSGKLFPNKTFPKSNVQVMVQTLNFVQDISPAAMTISLPPEIEETSTEKNPQGMTISPPEIEETITEKKPSKTKRGRVIDEETSNSWKDLLENPEDWLDHRGNKANGRVNPKHPDFKRKGDGISLWLNMAPEWVLPNLEGLKFDVFVPKILNEHLWKDLAENPDKWWDNRSKKRNPRAPDFINRETDEALWMNNSPTWVLSKLPPMKKKKED